MSARPNLALVPAPAPPFEGFDGELTTENLEQLVEEIAAQRDEIAGLGVTIRSQAAIIGRLERVMEDADPTTHPQHAEMAALIDRWKAATGHPKAKKSKDRFEAIKARLKDGYTFDNLALAIDGIGAYPFVVNAERRSQGKPAERHDSLVTIAFKSGENVERFANLGHRAHREGLVSW